MGKCFSKEKKGKKKRNFDLESQFEKRREQLNKLETELNGKRAALEREQATFRVEKANLKSQQDAAMSRTTLANEKLTALEATKAALQKAKETLENQQKEIQAKQTALVQLDGDVSFKIQQLRDYHAKQIRTPTKKTIEAPELSVTSEDEFDSMMTYHPPSTPESEARRRVARLDSTRVTNGFESSAQRAPLAPINVTDNTSSPSQRKIQFSPTASSARFRNVDSGDSEFESTESYASAIDALAAAARNKQENDVSFALICIENICSKSVIEAKESEDRCNEICRNIVVLLQHYSTGKHIIFCEKALAAISYLCSYGLSANSFLTAFSAQKSVLVVQHCIAIHKDIPDIVTLGCDSLHKLLTDRTSLTMSGIHGSCDLVVDLLRQYSSSGTTVEGVLKVFLCLTMDASNRHLFSSTGYVSILTDCGKRFIDNLAIGRIVCSIIANLAQEEENRSKLATEGLDEMLLDLIKRHKQHIDHAQLGCLAISGIVNSNKYNSIKLGDLGACDLVVSLLNRHKDAGVVVEAAALAIMNLAVVDKNNEKFEYSGACEGIMAAFRFAESTRKAAWLAMINLAVRQRNREKLGEVGACAAIAGMIDIEHMESSRQWCMLINNLCANCIDNKIRFGDEGVCETLVRVVHRWYGSELVVRQAIGAIKNLCAIEENCEKFMELDICLLLSKVLVDFAQVSWLVDKVSISLEFLGQVQENGPALRRCRELKIASILAHVGAEHGANAELSEQIAITLSVLEPNSTEPVDL